MPGTVSGGRKAAATTKANHGEDFFKRIGKKGGQSGHTGGVAGDSVRAALIGKKGGARSRRGWKLFANKDGFLYYKNKTTGEIMKIMEA